MIVICQCCKKVLGNQRLLPGAFMKIGDLCDRCKQWIFEYATYDTYIHQYPEQEAAVRYLVAHWRSFRLEARRLRRSSIPLPELYDICLGVRTTALGPGAAFKLKGMPLPEDPESTAVLIPQNVGKERHWFNAWNGLEDIGVLRKISSVVST